MEPNANKKTIKTPDSDQSARKDSADLTEEIRDDTDATNRQTSNKSGKHSSVEKLTASRPEFGPSPGTSPVPGAFGNPEESGDEHAPSEAHRDQSLRPK